MAGHWLLARLGKRVLRPGGRELTERMLDAAMITDSDIVELAPGLGRTAQEIIRRGPRSYRGIDTDPAAVEHTNRRLGGAGTVTQADAANTGLPDASADIVFGEAMLTMQSDRAKLEMMTEAFRILKPGGRYVIHELGLTPDGLDDATKQEIQRALAKSIKVNARPLTSEEWRALLTRAGFTVREDTRFAPMRLLQPRRIIADEGISGALRFARNLMSMPEERSRVLGMRRTFHEHQKALTAVGIVAEKPR
ncbi:methyltransferase domain-containing protein [Leucobacter sp. CSA2]|uniref:Methyltransferase domain-containing protein n=2 Tax=Leucobacter edaphi TaxID=2796472 RepID=A0A934QDV2_9MICO|nr:class I SAM-dependent methyltransferase [Leucobacter edaphi]MBK0421419.1 methyltransferase domain-containing protein [Leucobacter edaphi]